MRAPSRILSSVKIRELFGSPDSYLLETGEISPDWERKILMVVDLPAPLPLLGYPGKVATRFRCHQRIAGMAARALDAAYADTEAWATVGDWGGCYAFRAVRGEPRSISRHSWGLAWDMDVADNPMGEAGSVHPRLIEILGGYGFCWGGRFSGRRRDPMHWEFAAPWLLESE